jgi:hypothetical protein
MNLVKKEFNTEQSLAREADSAEAQGLRDGKEKELRLQVEL